MENFRKSALETGLYPDSATNSFVISLSQSLHWDQCMLGGEATWQCGTHRRKRHKADYCRSDVEIVIDINCIS